MKGVHFNTGGFIAAYQALVRGGSEFSDRLDRSVQTRIKDDIPLDNGLCFDLTHPDAFKNKGKHEIATFDQARQVWVPVLGEEDFDLNRAAFSPAGDSAGLNYNIFCSGHVQLPDGRIAFFGGHYIDGDNGIRKVNIFDPVTETWVDRPMPPLHRSPASPPTSTSVPRGVRMRRSWDSARLPPISRIRS